MNLRSNGRGQTTLAVLHVTFPAVASKLGLKLPGFPIQETIMATSPLSPVKRLAAFRPEGKAGTALLAGAAVLAASALWNTSRARRAERDHPPRGSSAKLPSPVKRTSGRRRLAARCMARPSDPPEQAAGQQRPRRRTWSARCRRPAEFVHSSRDKSEDVPGDVSGAGTRKPLAPHALGAVTSTAQAAWPDRRKVGVASSTARVSSRWR